MTIPYAYASGPPGPANALGSAMEPAMVEVETRPRTRAPRNSKMAASLG